MANKCIVSLATKNSRYVDGLARLSNSLRDNADGIDFLGFIHEHSVGAPLHTENNYAFKVYAIQKAIDAGYTSFLWLDASVYAMSTVHPIFDLIEQQGYWFEGAGCYLNEWCTDEAFEYFGLIRRPDMPMIQSGFMGFNIEKPIGYQLWLELKQACNDGIFNGEWANYRHDQTAISCILTKHNIKFSHTPEYVQYAGLYDKILNDKIIFKCEGL